MICLRVDESYAFDYLSILELKYRMDKENSQKKLNYTACYDYLKTQLGDLFLLITGSEEYKECLKANMMTFQAVDKAKTDEVPASHVDRCNFQRHSAKQALQKKFFNNDLTELKIGYEVYDGPRTSL